MKKKETTIKSGRPRKTGLRRLLQIAGTKRWLLFASVVLSVAASISQFVPFVAIYKILNELAVNASDTSMIDEELIWSWGYIMIWAFVCFGILSLASTLCSHFAAFNILYEFRIRLARKLVRLPMGFFTKRSTGDLKKIMGEDVERIELFVAHHFPDIVTAVVFPLLLIGYMFIVDWRLSLILILFLASALSIISTFYKQSRIKAFTEKYLQAIGKMNSSLIEYIRGIQVVKTFTKSTSAYKQLNDDIKDYRDYVYSVNKVYRSGYVWFQMLLLSPLLLIIPVATYYITNAESYTAFLPTALMFFIFSFGIFFPVMKIMWIGSLLTQNTMGVQQIDDILYKEELDNYKDNKQLRNTSVIFDNVDFSYDNTPILKNISFTAKPGTITALVGPSGAGKTTIAMLAARFWDVGGGEIRIGGAPIKQIKIKKLMEKVSFVFQDNMLFFDTIEENIRMGNKKATHDDIVRAAKAAQCHDFIVALPDGYSTLVGEGGTYLSGGEQQRIALARVVLKNAPIILLDEATAYADPENEGKILDAFAHLIKGKTVIVIAHRLSTIVNADQILYIDEGRIAESGTHSQLLEKKGSYEHMWNTYNKTRNWTIGGDS